MSTTGRLHLEFFGTLGMMHNQHAINFSDASDAETVLGDLEAYYVLSCT